MIITVHPAMLGISLIDVTIYMENEICTKIVQHYFNSKMLYEFKYSLIVDCLNYSIPL